MSIPMASGDPRGRCQDIELAQRGVGRDDRGTGEAKGGLGSLWFIVTCRAQRVG
jgi:hypothetical protein